MCESSRSQNVHMYYVHVVYELVSGSRGVPTRSNSILRRVARTDAYIIRNEALSLRLQTLSSLL